MLRKHGINPDEATVKKEGQRDQYRVTRIDGLFQIKGAEERSVTYCRIYTKNGNWHDVAIGWQSTLDSNEAPNFETNLLFDFRTLASNDAFEQYISGVVTTALFVKMASYTKADVAGVIALLQIPET